jgi:hypothetical protein
VRKSVLAALLFGFSICALADDAAPPPPGPSQDEDAVRTVKDTTAHSEPRADAEAAFTVAAGTDLTWVVKGKKDGFLRVIRRNRGPQGWIAEGDLTVTQEHQHGKKPEDHVCAASLDACPARGCNAEGSPEARDNEMKRTWPPAGSAAVLTIDDLIALQRAADEKVGQGPNDLTPEQRAKLQHLQFSGRTISEGDRVRALGYIARGGEGLHINESGEPVNCNLKKPDDNDFHIPLVAKSDDSEFKGIVVEMIPQQRPSAWTIEALKEIQVKGQQVWVEGGLSYDKVHYVNADADNELEHEPERISLWEIHPIAKFLVCRREHCDPQDERQWSEL